MIRVERDLEFYLRQQYSVLLRPLAEDDGGGWLAEVVELPGCMSDGETREEALKNLEEAKRAWIKVAFKRGLEIPLPRGLEEEFSGRLTLRMPKVFHKQLARAAEKEGVSLNQFILSILSFGYGALYGRRAPRERELFIVAEFLQRTKPPLDSAFTNVSSLIETSWRASREKLAEV